MNALTATEWVISIAAPAVLGRLLGAPAAAVASYHRMHFIILNRIATEVSRDWDIQMELRNLQVNLRDLASAVSKVLHIIYMDPKPPSVEITYPVDNEKMRQAQQRIDDYYVGVKNTVGILDMIIRLQSDVLDRTNRELAEISKKLNTKDSKMPGIRRYANHYREFDIFCISNLDMGDIRNLRGKAMDLRNVYRKQLGLQRS